MSKTDKLATSIFLSTSIEKKLLFLILSITVTPTYSEFFKKFYV